MAVTSAAKAASTKHTKSASPAITIERARLLCPNFRIVENISAALGLSVPDFKGIREAHELALCRMSNSFGEELNERASQMQFQRLTGSLIAAAIRGGEFYSEKVTEARDATSSLANEARDNDLDGPIGFESRAERKRTFAAEMAMQAYAFLAAAEGALAAYAQITGEDWKPYQAAAEGPARVERKSATAQMGAFQA